MATSNGADVNYDQVFKILLVGDSMVGKSSLVLRYAKNEFKVDFMTTIGVDFLSRTESYDNTKVRLHVSPQVGEGEGEGEEGRGMGQEGNGEG